MLRSLLVDEDEDDDEEDKDEDERSDEPELVTSAVEKSTWNVSEARVE